jgi:hypothetical protein
MRSDRDCLGAMTVTAHDALEVEARNSNTIAALSINDS